CDAAGHGFCEFLLYPKSDANRSAGQGKNHRQRDGNEWQSRIAPIEVPSYVVSKCYESGRRNQRSEISETHKGLHSQLRSARNIAHQVPHTWNERSYNEHPTAQILEPVLGFFD